jgi:SsrA-binding protein
MKLITKNKKAYFEYEILDQYTCGVVLFGSEVKPIKNGEISLSESYCIINNGEVFIKGSHVAQYTTSGKYDNHDPKRDRKLLLKKKEILKLKEKVGEKGLTIIPLNIHLTDNGLIKVSIGLCRGKKLWDKRQTIKDRDIKRDIDRQIK